MTVQDYLLKFRKISSLESLEKLYDHLNYTLTDDQELINMYRAADHRRAEDHDPQAGVQCEHLRIVLQELLGLDEPRESAVDDCSQDEYCQPE